MKLSKRLAYVLNWITDVTKEKFNQTIDKSLWVCVNEENTPKQTNGYDCGMFVLMCATYCSDDLPLLYTQKDMPSNRKKVGAAILRGYLNF